MLQFVTEFKVEIVLMLLMLELVCLLIADVVSVCSLSLGLVEVSLILLEFVKLAFGPANGNVLC